MMMAALTVTSFTACSSDDDDVNTDAERIAGTYTGDTEAKFTYGTLTYEDDVLTLTANSDGTANVSYTNDTDHLVTESPVAMGFGTFTDSKMKVTANSDGSYSMSGSGSVAISMSASATGKSYAYTSEYTVKGSVITAVYTFEGLMGTTVLTFTSSSKK